MDKKERIIKKFLEVEKRLKDGETLNNIQKEPIKFSLSGYGFRCCQLCVDIYSRYSQINGDETGVCPKAIYGKKFTRKELANLLAKGKIKAENKEKFFFIFFINILTKDIEKKKNKNSLFFTFNLNIIEKALDDENNFNYKYTDSMLDWSEDYYDERVYWKFLLLKILGF